MQSVWCASLMHGWGKIRLDIATRNFLWLCCAQALSYLDDLNTRTLATTNWVKGVMTSFHCSHLLAIIIGQLGSASVSCCPKYV